MATNDDKQNIWIHIGDAKPIALSINRADEPNYREAERLVNSLWLKWMNRFQSTSSPYEVMTRVAFQFARLYSQAYARNVAVDEYLKEFERDLDDLVVND